MERVLFAPRELPPPLPDVAQDARAYSDWVRSREGARARRRRGAGGPVLGLVMLLGDAEGGAVDTSLRALRAQTTDRWTLTMVTAGRRPDDLAVRVDSILGRRLRRRVRWVEAPRETPLPQLLHAGLTAQAGNPAALLFPGDAWAPAGVDLLGRALAETGVVYADEDLRREDGTHEAPRLKPGYSPDFWAATSYVGRPLAVGAALLADLPELVSTDLATLEQECALVVCGRAASVTHVPEVLCHRTVPPPRKGGTTTFSVVRTPVTPCSVSVLIPFRDEPRLLRTCVDSVTASRGPHQVELLLIDNGSSDPETRTLVERLSSRPDVRVRRDPRPFNWAALNNAGAAEARGEVLLFLNNDIEAPAAGWLDALCAHALRPDVAAVGARLLYPDRRLQHCGIVLGMTGAAGHPLVGLPADEPGYLHMATATRECSAVTGACLATRRDVFDLLDGFDEALGVDLNDVDYCLRAWDRGLRTVYEPRAELIHHESPSRGTAGGVGDIVRFLERWHGSIAAGDRFFNTHLTRANQSCGLAGDDEQESWDRWYETVTTT